MCLTMKLNQTILPNRRQFLARSLAAGAIASQAATLLARSANEQVHLGIVGCGWRGGQLLDTFKRLDGVEITGLCDPDRVRLCEAAEGLTNVQTWTDMRDMFDSPDIDAVVIANPNHWHCLSAIWAMQAGKDVYVEKPLGQTQWEGLQLVNAVERYGRICQVGTQQRSDPMQAQIRDFLHQEEALGNLLRVNINRFGVRKSIGKREQCLELPNTVDYDLWLGPAEDVPIFRDQLQYDWHWVWNTGSGELGNWGVHILDDVRGNIFRDETLLPNKVLASGGRCVWNDAGETPNLQFVVYDVDGIAVTTAICNLPLKKGSPRMPGPESGYVAYYEGGRYEGQRGSGVAFDSDNKEIRQFEGNGGSWIHQMNFIEAVRANDPKLLNTPVEMGFASTSWSNLANIATRLPVTEGTEGSFLAQAKEMFGEESLQQSLELAQKVIHSHEVGDATSELSFGSVLSIDSDKGLFTGLQAEAANKLLKRKDRAPFIVPEIQSV